MSAYAFIYIQNKFKIVGCFSIVVQKYGSIFFNFGFRSKYFEFGLTLNRNFGCKTLIRIYKLIEIYEYAVLE